MYTSIFITLVFIVYIFEGSKKERRHFERKTGSRSDRQEKPDPDAILVEQPGSGFSLISSPLTFSLQYSMNLIVTLKFYDNLGQQILKEKLYYSGILNLDVQTGSGNFFKYNSDQNSESGSATRK